MADDALLNFLEESNVRDELTEARDEFEDLFSSIRSILITVDAEGVVRRWSDTASKAFAIEAAVAIGALFRDLPIQWDWPTVARAADVSREAQLPARVDDLPYNTASGEMKLLGLTVSPTRRGGYLIMGADVTNRKEEERLLMERERFYRSIVDNIQDVIFETDAEGRWTFLNPAFERIVGVGVNEETGRHAYERIWPEDRRMTTAKLARVLRGASQNCRFEVRYSKPDGTPGWAEVHVEAQRDEEKVLIGTFGTIREISVRKRNGDLERQLSEQLLRATEDRVKTIIESAPLMVFSIDKEGILTFIDGQALERIGRTPQELEGRSMFEISPKPEIQGYIRRALAGESVTAEIQSGEVFLEVRYSPVFDADGNPNGTTGVGIDITDSKLLESQLLHARKMESIGHLAAGLAHEVNTPTQYIADNTRFIQDNFEVIRDALLAARTCTREAGGEIAEEFERRWVDGDLDYLLEEVPFALKQSLEGLTRVTGIVKSMKQFSHPGTVDRQWANLNEQLESTLTVSRNEWKYVAEVETKFDPNLPLVHCLPAELNQVFLNMIVNAAHSIEECVSEGKYPQGMITISTKRDGDWVEISISDNAKGIAPSIVEKIFDPFFTTKDPGKGTGQGLALANNVVVDQHHGQIGVKSQLGKGTTFAIRIPIGTEAEQPMIEKEAA